MFGGKEKHICERVHAANQMVIDLFLRIDVTRILSRFSLYLFFFIFYEGLWPWCGLVCLFRYECSLLFSSFVFSRNDALRNVHLRKLCVIFFYFCERVNPHCIRISSTHHCVVTQIFNSPFFGDFLITRRLVNKCLTALVWQDTADLRAVDDTTSSMCPTWKGNNLFLDILNYTVS